MDLTLGISLCSLPVVGGPPVIGGSTSAPILGEQSFGVEVVASKLDPLVGTQSFAVDVVGSEAAPVAGAQSFAVDIAAELGGGFDPLTDLTEPIAWIDMQDDTAYTLVTTTVSSVTNKVSSVVWSEATDRPDFSATGINGLPCMNLNGSSDFIGSTEAAVLAAMADQQDYYLAIVVAADDLDAVEVMFGGCKADGTGNKRWGTNTTGSGKYTAIGTPDSGSAIVVDSTANTTNSPVLLEFYSISQATSIRINGGAAAPSGTATAYGTLTPAAFAIGCRMTTVKALFFDGKIGEIIFCADGNAAARADCATYLIDKWAIA